jgi:hypothetical protein
MEREEPRREEPLNRGDKALLAVILLLVASWALSSGAPEAYPVNDPVENTPTPTRVVYPSGYTIEKYYQTAEAAGTPHRVPVRPNPTPTIR